MKDGLGMWYETAIATVGVAGMVCGAAYGGPGPLRMILFVGGSACVWWTFYSIFEAIEIQCYRTFTDPDGPGGGPDDGEHVVITHNTLFKCGTIPPNTARTVVDFPKRAA
jgi:hypothetical protein